MKSRIFAMTSTMAAALALLAAPAVAGQSTRAEREATRQLNLQAAQQAQSSNQASSEAKMPKVADAAASLPANSPPAAAPTARIESGAIADPQAPAGPSINR